MLKKLLNGFIWGTGFSLALIAILFFALPTAVELFFDINEDSNNRQQLVTEAPAVQGQDRFLGSHATYSGGFDTNDSKRLSSGEGQITGIAKVNDKPLEGLRLRLALNGSVMSQWATTDSSGSYTISVPFGEYRVDGYELDHTTINSILPGKISHPRSRNSSDKFSVTEKSVGQGIKFMFVDPVVKHNNSNMISTSDPVELSWGSYPGASEYAVQLHEKSEANSWKSKSIFNWSERPRTAETRIAIGKYGVELKPGHFYAFEVFAYDSEGDVLSKSYRDFMDYDFEVSDAKVH